MADRSRTLPSRLIIWGLLVAFAVLLVGGILSAVLPRDGGSFAWTLCSLVMLVAGLIFAAGLIAKVIEIGVRAGRQD